jgi:hypothetical protein
MNRILLPPSHARRLEQIRHALEIERRMPSEFHGKRLQSARYLISVPLGRRWRALFAETENGYKFRDCLTHERYNKVNFANYGL